MANGFILIDKKVGVTSRSVDNKIQRLFHTRKVGHLGTLDPFASGLLIIAVDSGCKSLPFIDDSFKTYQAKLKFGEKTSSGDLTGEILSRKEVPHLEEVDVIEALNSFVGISEQTPPMTSALHHDGQRLYDLSRRGIEVERKPRQIEIKSIKLLSFSDNYVEFEVNCSRGTYVRTLGEDIASKLGTVGHLIELRRISIGDISVESAKDIDEIKESDLINPAHMLTLTKVIVEDEKTLKDIYNGKAITLETSEDRVLLCKKENNELIALAVYNRKEGDLFSPIRGLWS